MPPPSLFPSLSFYSSCGFDKNKELHTEQERLVSWEGGQLMSYLFTTTTTERYAPVFSVSFCLFFFFSFHLICLLLLPVVSLPLFLFFLVLLLFSSMLPLPVLSFVNFCPLICLSIFFCGFVTSIVIFPCAILVLFHAVFTCNFFCLFLYNFLKYYLSPIEFPCHLAKR